MGGVDITTIKALLGHKSLEYTLRYARLAPNHKTKAVNVLDRLWSQNPPQQETPESKVVEFKRR